MLDATRLGIAIDAAFSNYIDVDVANFPNARIDIATKLAAAIINEIKTNGELVASVPTGFSAGSVLVTGTANSWKIK